MLRTRSGLPKNCSWHEDRHGTRRVRFRKAGFSTYLSGIPWSEEFMRQYAAALEGLKAQNSSIGVERTIPGSINSLIVSYYRSPGYRGLRASTQAVRKRIIEAFRVEFGDKPTARLGKAHVRDILGAKANTPEAANNLRKVLRILYAHAIDIGMTETNPVIGVPPYKSREGGLADWSEAEIGAFEAYYPIGSKPRLAFALALFTAQRVSDVARMGWQHARDDRIAVTQQKTGARLAIPIHPELARILESVPRSHLTFLTTDRGAPFSAEGLSNWFGKQCRAAGLLRRTAHGLRKAACRRLAEAGATVHEIAAISGHKTLGEVERYTKAVDQVRLASQAIARQLRAEREQVLSNPETRLDKTGENG